MKLSNRLENALSNDILKMEVAVKMGISYSTMIRYLTKRNDKFLSDIGKSALIEKTGIPESELFEFEIDVWYRYVSNGQQEKEHQLHTIKSGSIQGAVNKAFEAYEDMDSIPFAAYYNDEKYTKTK